MVEIQLLSKLINGGFELKSLKLKSQTQTFSDGIVPALPQFTVSCTAKVLFCKLFGIFSF